LNAPLLSVVIPTSGRPDLLPRAIQSALASGPRDSVEVLVVPNGPDLSWKDALLPFDNEAWLRVHPIETAHANAARNRGLSLSRGKYLRFLDDDDFLYPKAAFNQLTLLESSNADMCAGRVESMSPGQRSHGLTTFPSTNDFACAALSVSGFTLPVGNLFRRAAVQRASWDSTVPRAQDYVWMMHLAGLREWSWLQYTEAVGVWFHHGGTRISAKGVKLKRPVWLVSAVLELVEKLEARNELTEHRRLAAGNALWRIAHQRFPIDPIYAHTLAAKALCIHDRSRPPHYPRTGGLVDRLVSPIGFEWAFLPKRYFNQFWRLRGPAVDDHVRHI